MTRKVIVNLCPTGMVPTKEQNPAVPVEPDEIIKCAIACADLGASVIHVHPRDDDGRPTWRAEAFARIIGGIREYNDSLVISATTSGRNWTEFERRSACLTLEGDLKPDVASLTVGSQNFSSQASVNEPSMIKQLATAMRDRGIKPELEVFEPGMVHMANYLIGKGVVSGVAPYFNILLGSLGTSPLHPSSFAAMHALLPEDAVWSLAGIGRHQLDANVLGLALGGHVRVGLEDNLWLDRDRRELASNEQLVSRIGRILALMDLEPATPAETREILQIA